MPPRFPVAAFIFSTSLFARWYFAYHLHELYTNVVDWLSELLSYPKLDWDTFNRWQLFGRMGWSPAAAPALTSPTRDPHHGHPVLAQAVPWGSLYRLVCFEHRFPWSSKGLRSTLERTLWRNFTETLPAPIWKQILNNRGRSMSWQHMDQHLQESRRAVNALKLTQGSPGASPGCGTGAMGLAGRVAHRRWLHQRCSSWPGLRGPAVKDRPLAWPHEDCGVPRHSCYG